jgi:hypothetical protein
MAVRENRRGSWPILYLHFDFKSVTPALLDAVWNLLVEYEGWITTAPKLKDPGALAPLDMKPIMVLTEESVEQEKVFFDRVAVGDNLRLFGSAVTRKQKSGQPMLTPEQIVARPATNYRRWWNSAWNVVEAGGQPQAGEWTAQSDARLRELVAYAHKSGYAIRFYTLNGHTKEEGMANGWDGPTTSGREKRWRSAGGRRSRQGRILSRRTRWRTWRVYSAS